MDDDLQELVAVDNDWLNKIVQQSMMRVLLVEIYILSVFY